MVWSKENSKKRKNSKYKKQSLPAGLRYTLSWRGHSYGQQMAENSLWNCMSGTCWKSEPRVPGKAVCEEVSHWRYSTTKPPEGGAGGSCWLLNPVSCFWFHLLHLLSSILLISALFIFSFLILGLWLFYPPFPSFLRLDS